MFDFLRIWLYCRRLRSGERRERLNRSLEVDHVISAHNCTLE